MRRLLHNLIDHMRWADACIASSLERDVPDAEAARLFAHIASVEHLWYSRIEARTPEHAVWPALTVGASRALAADHAELFDRLIRDAGDAGVARLVRYRNSAGKEFTNSVCDIVAHTAMHGSHHRGQIAHRLRTIGQEPPYVDYIQFARREQ